MVAKRTLDLLKMRECLSAPHQTLRRHLVYISVEQLLRLRLSSIYRAVSSLGRSSLQQAVQLLGLRLR